MTENVTKIPSEGTTRIDMTQDELVLLFECFKQSGFKSDVLETAGSAKRKLIDALESFDE